MIDQELLEEANGVIAEYENNSKDVIESDIYISDDLEVINFVEAKLAKVFY
jgi:hypothetical protein